LSGLSDDGGRSIRYTRAATEVTVRDGQTFELGGLGGRNDFLSKFLVGVDRRGNTRSLKITATPHIISP
jgi:hypothetical protein